jgi:hypothetical protein
MTQENRQVLDPQYGVALEGISTAESMLGWAHALAEIQDSSMSRCVIVYSPNPKNH